MPVDTPVEHCVIEPDLTHDFIALSERVVRVAGIMRQAAQEWQERGIFPPESLETELGEARAAFRRLQSAADAVVRQMKLPAADGGAETLPDLESQVRAVQQAREQNALWEKTRLRLTIPLERVLKIIHRDTADFAPLHAAHGKAVALRSRIVEMTGDAGAGEGNREAIGAEVEPFVHLLTLVESPDPLEDREWDRLIEAVTEAFGKPLAVACARGRLILPIPRSVSSRAETAQDESSLRPYMHF